MFKVATAASVLAIIAGSAFAQTTPAPPVGPTAVECNQGWKEGSQWTKEQFTAACLKLKEGQKQ